MATPRILPEHLVAEQPVIHPALDWRENVLMMGVTQEDGGLGVITSNRQMLTFEQLDLPICDRASNFSRSPVSTEVARRLQENYGTPTNENSAYALVNVPAQLAAYYRRFVVFPETWWPEVLALWTMGTYLYPIFNAYPYLRISSPEPGCGKTVLGKLIARLSFNGEFMTSPTEANIFRMAESERGTQVWDEVENQHEVERNRLHTLQAVLLNGYSAGASIPRQERTRGGQFRTVRFHVYVPRVLIGLSDLPQVVQQRAIELMLHGLTPAHHVEQHRPDERVSEEADMRGLCALWALTYCNAVARQYRREDLSRGLERHLRQAGRLTNDILLPLFAVGASLLDGDRRSRDVIRPMLRTMFDEAAPAIARSWNETAVTTPDWLVSALNILEQCNELEPAQLAAMVASNLGESLSAERLARGLRRYGILSVRRNGRRVFSTSPSEIAALRSHYRIETSEEAPISTGVALPASTSGH